jgi:hypothetical protein
LILELPRSLTSSQTPSPEKFSKITAILLQSAVLMTQGLAQGMKWGCSELRSQTTCHQAESVQSRQTFRLDNLTALLDFLRLYVESNDLAEPAGQERKEVGNGDSSPSE